MDVFAMIDALWLNTLALLATVSGMALVARGLHLARLNVVRRGGGLVGVIEGFRLVVAGLVLLGLVAAWYWQTPLFLFLALGIGFVEFLESSVLIAAMRRDGGRVTVRRA